VVNITMPYGYKFNDTASLRATVLSSNASVDVDDAWENYGQVKPKMPLEIPLSLRTGEALVTADLMIYWCEAINETLCFVDHRQVNVPVLVEAGAAGSTMSAEVALIPPVQ
jgi:hypothetical protein